MHIYKYGMNILGDLMYWTMYEVIIFLSEPKKTHLTLSFIPPQHSLDTDGPSSAGLSCFAMENILLLPHLNECTMSFKGFPVVFQVAL